MKKLLFLAAISFVAASNHVRAQSEMNNYAFDNFNVVSNTSGVAGNGTADMINAKAIKNFSRDYPYATAAEWSPLKDKGFLCRFSYKGVSERAYYNAGGGWLFTIAGYQEAQLPKDIRSMVKGVYYDYAITFVNEISLSDDRKIFLVQVKDDKRIKILRIADDEMEVIQVFEN